MSPAKPRVRFLHSRAAFHHAVAHAGLILADFSTSRSHLTHASAKAGDVLQGASNASLVSLGVSFSHLTSGLPFDFSLQAGLVRVQGARDTPRRLHELSTGWRELPRRMEENSTGWRELPRRLEEYSTGWRPFGGKDQLWVQPAGRARRQRERRFALSKRRRARPSPPATAPREGSEAGGGGAKEGKGDVRGEEGSKGAAVVGAMWHEQIRFIAPAERGERRGAADDDVGDGNGGDDFTFTFPREDRLYRVFGFGFDIHDNAVTTNETLSLYDERARLLGRLDVAALNRSGFVGFVSDVPIGFASFDESEEADEIGIAGFVFGYRELEAPEYPPLAWAALGGGVALLLLCEARALHRAPLGLRLALLWLLALLVLEAGVVAALRCAFSWRQATLFTFACVLNSLLSADNLFVFMLLLQDVGLRRDHHLLAICHGMLLAVGARALFVLMGAALLQRFSSLLLAFAVFLLVAGVKMLTSAPPALPTSADSTASQQRWATRCIGWLVPLKSDDSTGAAYFVYDERGRLCATRMLITVVGICVCDVLFALDSIPAVLSITTSSFLLVSSQAMSLLQLRAVYFLLEGIAEYLGSMQQVLAVVLILIASKIILEAAGVVVPLSLFVAVLVAWRVLAALFVFVRPACERTLCGHRTLRSVR